MRKVTDDELVAAWERNQNYAQVGRELGIAGQTAQARLNRLRGLGVALLPSKPAGYALTSERAREIGQLRKKA